MIRHCRTHRHTGIPKGFLLHITLQLLRHEPLSGSEIMEQFQEYTDYKPSPGSVYPLLARLQENDLIEEVPDEDPNLKRYRLTNAGRAELAEALAHDSFMKERQNTIRKIYWRLHRNIPEDLYTSFSNFLDCFERSHRYALESIGKKNELIQILDEATSKMEKLGEAS